MTRLLKKCIFLSVGLHVVVAAILIAAAAFFITKPEKVTPTLSMIAPEVLDNLLNPQTAPAQARVTPAPTPPQPPVQRNRTPEPPTPRPPKKVAPVPTPTPPKKVTPKPTPKKVSTPKKTTRPPKSTPAKKRPAIKINTSTKTVNGGGSTSRPPVTPAKSPSVNTEGLGKTVKNLRTQLSAGIKGECLRRERGGVYLLCAVCGVGLSADLGAVDPENIGTFTSGRGLSDGGPNRQSAQCEDCSQDR